MVIRGPSRRPKAAELRLGAEEDLLGFYALPKERWSKLRSTNPLERVNREIGRRSDVAGIFPNDASLIRLAGALLIEQCDEWMVSRRSGYGLPWWAIPIDGLLVSESRFKRSEHRNRRSRPSRAPFTADSVLGIPLLIQLHHPPHRLQLLGLLGPPERLQHPHQITR